METQTHTKIIYAPPSIWKRVAAFVIDALVAFIPALTMYLVFAGGSFPNKTVLFYESPIIGAVSMYDLPKEVNDRLNTFDNEDGKTTHQEYNVSFGATVCRCMSVIAIAFYVFYSTFCAYIFDGKTVGKKIMNLRMIVEDSGTPPEDEQEKKEWEKRCYRHIFVREVLGKVILNSIPVFPVISVFTIFFTKKKKALHDMMGKTIVVEEIIVPQEMEA